MATKRKQSRVYRIRYISDGVEQMTGEIDERDLPAWAWMKAMYTGVVIMEVLC